MIFLSLSTQIYTCADSGHFKHVVNYKGSALSSLELQIGAAVLSSTWINIGNGKGSSSWVWGQSTETLRHIHTHTYIPTHAPTPIQTQRYFNNVPSTQLLLNSKRLCWKNIEQVAYVSWVSICLFIFPDTDITMILLQYQHPRIT